MISHLSFICSKIYQNLFIDFNTNVKEMLNISDKNISQHFVISYN